MGNCLRSQAKIVRVVKTDGKILEYRASIKVNDILLDFKGHALSEMLPVKKYLEPDTELVGGGLYYLIPLPNSPLKAVKKKVRFSEPEVREKNRENQKAGVRIKLVMSKQELKEMIENGVISMDRIAIKPQEEESEQEDLSFQSLNSYSWKPALKSIPELD